MHPAIPRRGGRERGAIPAAFGVLLVLVALIVATHRLRNRSFIGAHGFLHAAIVFSVLDRGVPPDNPFATGTELPYYWAFHVAAAGLVRAFALSPLHAFEVLNLLGLSLFVLAIVGVGRRLPGSRWRGLLAALLALVAVNPFGPVLLGARILGGDVDLSVTASPALHTHPLRGALYWDDSRYCPNLIYFLNPSARALALGLVAVVLRAGFLAGPVRPAWLLLSGLLLGAANPLFALGGLAALAAAGVLVRGRPGCAPSIPRHHWRAVAALAVGTILSAPTWWHLLSASQEASGPAFVLSEIPAAAIRLAWSAGPVMVLAWLGARAARRRGDGREAVLFLAGVFLLLLALLIRLPQQNELYFFSLAVVLLAVPAAGAPFFRGRTGRPTLLAGLLALVVFLPTPLLDGFAFWHREPTRILATAERLECTFWPERLRVHAWLRDATPAESIVLDLAWPEEPLPPVQQNVSLVPAATRRRLYLDRPSYVVAKTEENARRFLRMHRIFLGWALGEPDRAALLASGRPVFVLCRRGDGLARVRRAVGPEAGVVYRDERYAVVRLPSRR